METESVSDEVISSALRDPPPLRRTSSMGNPAAGRNGAAAPLGLELKRFPRTMSDSNVNPLEAWRDERSRARRYRESKRIRPMVCSGEIDAEEAESCRMEDEEQNERKSNHSSVNHSSGAINGFPLKERRQKLKKAWKSGSMLVRPRADNGSERVARTMYIYLVGSQKMEVELLIGPPGSQLSKAEEKDTVVRTMMSAGKHVCIPEHKTYLVRNMSDKRTAVLFWASPNEASGGGVGGGGGEEKKKELEEKNDVKSTLARFFPVPA